MTEHVETVVIGAGQAGLSVGHHLAERGRAFVILDANERVGDNWRRPGAVWRVHAFLTHRVMTLKTPIGRNCSRRSARTAARCCATSAPTSRRPASHARRPASQASATAGRCSTTARAAERRVPVAA